jgi:hypothetical protein
MERLYYVRVGLKKKSSTGAWKWKWGHKLAPENYLLFVTGKIF